MRKFLFDIIQKLLWIAFSYYYFLIRLDDPFVADLQRQLAAKDILLTETRLEALTSASQLQGLRETVIKLKSGKYRSLHTIWLVKLHILFVIHQSLDICREKMTIWNRNCIYQMEIKVGKIWPEKILVDRNQNQYIDYLIIEPTRLKLMMKKYPQLFLQTCLWIKILGIQ